MTGQFDYYAILGIKKDASIGEIRDAFISLRTQIPKAKQNPKRNKRYKRILNAFEVLGDTQRRSIYDSLLVETDESTLEIKIQASRDQIHLTDNPQLIYLLIDLLPPSQQTQAQSQLPLNLCLVIDRSTSMKGERLQNVKKAVDMIVEKMTTNDVLSIISFSDRADVVVSSEPVQNKLSISSKVRSVFPSGGTEIFQGLNAGYKEMIKHDLNNYTNHLILLTDGHTYGDAKQCLELAEQASKKGIGFSAFGIGSEWNDLFLDKLVSPSGGQSGFIESPENVIAYLQKRIKGLGQVFARNVHLVNEFPKSVKIENSFKIQPFAQPIDCTDKIIKLGDIEERAPLSILLELRIESQPIETRINIPFSFSVLIPSQQNQARNLKQNYQILVMSEPTTEKPPEDIVNAVRSLSMYRMNEKVQEEIEAGNVDMATTRMRFLSTRLLQAGEAQLAHQAHNEAERLANMGSLSSEGQKRLKYGTRALLNQTSALESNDPV